MKAAYILFDGLTALDFIGVYDPLGRLRTMNVLPEFSWRVCAMTKTVTDDRGLLFTADTVGESLAGYDLIIIPGGFGTKPLETDRAFLAWLATASDVPLKTSVCTGAMLLGAAGFLGDRPATTHHNSYADLAYYCKDIRTDRVVDAGDVITAGGVSSAISLGLHLVERFAGADARRIIARQMDYPY